MCKKIFRSNNGLKHHMNREHFDMHGRDGITRARDQKHSRNDPYNHRRYDSGLRDNFSGYDHYNDEGWQTVSYGRGGGY